MEHLFITLSYKLYVINGDRRGLVEQTTADEPFEFVSGFGIALDEFECQVVGLQKGATFDFTLAPAQAYGEYNDEAVLELPREDFFVGGSFDSQNVYKGAAIPLQNETGDRYMARVLEVTDDTVILDLNHPLAGNSLQFVGEIIDAREATDEEVIQTINGGCGSGCGDCDGGCSDNKPCGCGKCCH